MDGRCCCCSLSLGSSIVLAFASVQAVLKILINTEILLLISESEVTNPFSYVININTIDDFDVFHGIVLAAVGLNGFWLAFAVFAFTGNITQSHGRLTPWTFLTYLLTLFQFGVSVYFAVKFQNSLSDTQEFFQDSVPTKTLTYLTLLCIYSGGGILMFFNLYLAHVVERRGKEIDHDYSALALYILSQMRCTHINDGAQQNLLPEAPPCYEADCPAYLPPQMFRRATNSSGSSWSLSYEALKNMNPDQQNTSSVINSQQRNISMAGHETNGNTTACTIFPY